MFLSEMIINGEIEKLESKIKDLDADIESLDKAVRRLEIDRNKSIDTISMADVLIKLEKENKELKEEIKKLSEKDGEKDEG